MHYLIRVIGQAGSHEEAHENALAFVDDLIERRELTTMALNPDASTKTVIRISLSQPWDSD